MIKLVILAVIVVGIAMPLTGCADSASVPDSVPQGDEAAIRATLDAFFDALRERDYEKAAGHVAGSNGMSDDERQELEQTLIWMRSTSTGFTSETFDNITITESTAKASYANKTTDEDGTFSFSVELDMKKEAGEWKVDLS